MKTFYSRTHALAFLGVSEATLSRAVLRGWLVPMRLGKTESVKTEFFLHSDLVDFREKCRAGYYEPSEVDKRRRLQRALRVQKR